MPSHAYPATVAECLDDGLRYRPATLAALERFRATYPWRGSLAERRRKIEGLHRDLCGVYGRTTELVWRSREPVDADSGASCYIPAADRIVMSGRPSVVTYLHEFAHALWGASERQACRWSLNLFRRTFPRSWARLAFSGHVVRAS